MIKLWEIILATIGFDSNDQYQQSVIGSRGMSHMLAIFNFDVSTKITCPFKMLHFDPNLISIGHLVVEIQTFFEV